LLKQVLDAEIEPAALARFLGTTSDQLEAFRTGGERMSTDLQLSFSRLVLARYPHFARLAHRVAAQAHAENAYHAKATETHASAPPSRYSR
jgi:hypothetical protein